MGRNAPVATITESNAGSQNTNHAKARETKRLTMLDIRHSSNVLLLIYTQLYSESDLVDLTNDGAPTWANKKKSE